MVKNPVANAEDIKDAGSISGLERSPEGGHGNHSSTLASRIPWTEELGRLQSTQSQRVRTTEMTEQACTEGDRVNGLLGFQCPNWKDKLITRADI